MSKLISRTQPVSTFWAKIFIAGPIDKIEQSCREYCLEGMCVTVTPTKYIYTMGEETGAEIGLINYPRFPNDPADITRKARELASKIMEDCHQGSYTVMTPDETVFYSRRESDK
jgi:hypothetical protein